MIRLGSDTGTVDLFPVIKGLVSESAKVERALGGDYDAAAASLGPEDITAIISRSELEETEISEADAVYSHFLATFGEIGAPSPAYCTLVDFCAENKLPLIPADMDDETYTEAYCRNISLMETMKERKIIRSGAKGGFDISSPEAFAKDWEGRFRKVKGFGILASERAEYMAQAIFDALNSRKRIAAFIETETADDVVRILVDSYGMREM